MYTTTEVLEISEISQFLAKDDQSKGMLFRGGYERFDLSWLINVVRDGIQWLFDYNPSSPNLLGQVNFLFSLCQPFVGRALQILGSGGSGTIVNPATGVISTIVAFDLEFIVGITPSPQIINGVNVDLPSDGDTFIQMLLPNVLDQSLSVFKDGVDLSTVGLDRLTYTPIYGLTAITITLGPDGSVFRNNDQYTIRGLQYISA